MDGEIGAWEPPTRLGDDHARVLDRLAAGVATGSDVLEVDDDGKARLREIINAEAAERERFFSDRASRRLVAWLRVLTLADETIPGCDAGAKSPVIALARLLRGRGDYPANLTPWIKSVSGNRFLPYGSLADRLKG